MMPGTAPFAANWPRSDTHLRSSSAIRIAVDPRNGALADTGYFPTWLTTREHPDSHMTFAGSQIPAFDKCTATVLELHGKMPYVRCIGWDVVVDKSNNVRVMEWNGHHNDIRFLEATQGPCFRDLHWEKLSVR
jgi:Sugar-transfer associated ATP-grasp